MVYRNPKQAFRDLYSLANNQGGYFTAKQAAGAGYGNQHLDYHTNVANFERIAQGLYRLPTIPISPHDDLYRWWFWSRNRADQPQAVVSHETALGLHDLGELLPGKLHFTVPLRFRKLAPRGCVLHRAALNPDDVQDYEAFKVTRPLRTLLDVAADEHVSSEQLGKAAKAALDRGLVQRSKLLIAAESEPGGPRLLNALGIRVRPHPHGKDVRQSARLQSLAGRSAAHAGGRARRSQQRPSPQAGD